jgi:hypothetical protein
MDFRGSLTYSYRNGTLCTVALHIMLLEEYVRKRKIRLLISDDFKEIFFSWIFAKKAELDHLRNDTVPYMALHIMLEEYVPENKTLDFR